MYAGELRHSASPLRYALFRALASEAHDPDTHVPDWLEHGAPLGISSPIQRAGIFPAVEPQDVLPEAARFHTRMAHDLHYKSLEEEWAWAQGKVAELVEEGDQRATSAEAG